MKNRKISTAIAEKVMTGVLTILPVAAQKSRQIQLPQK